MDKISNNSQIKCPKHPNREAYYVKIDKLNDSNQALFCDLCIKSDKTYQLSDFIHIQSIIDASENQIFDNWPPFDDQSLNEQIQRIQDDQRPTVQERIINFFDDFKRRIVSKIEEVKKDILKTYTNFINNEQNGNDLHEKIKEISKIKAFQDLLKSNHNEVNKNLFEFISKFISKKNHHTQIMKEVIKKYNDLSFENANTILDSVLSQIGKINFPIFNEEIDLLNSLELIKSEFEPIHSSQITCQRLLNNSIQINSPNNYSQGPFYSNIIFDRQKKYIFRLQFERNLIEGEALLIGLIKEEDKDINFHSGLSCRFWYCRQSIGHYYGRGIDKEVKGSLVNTGQINCLEMRVCIEEQIVEVVDYPNYENKLSLLDEQLDTLKQFRDFRLSIYLENTIKLTLFKACIVNSFNN